MDSVADLLDEMEANWELKEATLPITPHFLQQLKDMSTYVGLIINLLYLAFATRNYHYREPDIDEWVVSSIEYLGYIQATISGILIYLYAKSKQKLIIKAGWRRFVNDNQSIYNASLIDTNNRDHIESLPYQMTHLILMLKGPDATEFIEKDEHSKEEFRNFGNVVTWLEMKLLSVSFFLTDTLFQYYVLYFGISLLGFFSETIYYSFHLLDVITRFSALQNVVRAVTENIQSLSATFLLLVIIVYVYTSWTFFYIQDNMYDWDVNGYDSDIVGENNCISMY